MRELLLIRHGKAEAAAFGGDPARALTDDGRAGVASVGAGLAALGLRPDALWHSPFRRAVETAELLAAALGVPQAATREEALLVPGASVERAARALNDAGARRLVCVSHLPLLPELVARLTGMRVDFGPGAVAHLVLAGPHGAVLIGLWSADLLARVR